MLNNQMERKGFRLHKFEAFNWGTFDRQVWHLHSQGENSLLTGNIGSGKSTMVDGLTTLLVPPRKLAFNKAAGAEAKERSLESYFYGYYTSQQDDMGKARSVGLRGPKHQGNHYSVLLAQFYSEAVAQTISLAQVFWLPPGESKVKRLFVVAAVALDIQQHFSDFGSQIKQLRKKLNSLTDLYLFDSFSQYQQQFSKWLGLGSDGKAMELFNQTISMKSVGSVTDFVRQNMLSRPDVEAQLQTLEQNYESLKRLHDSVLAARKKVEMLQPIDRLGREALQASEDKLHFELCRELTDCYMASLAIELYENRLTKLKTRQHKLTIQTEQLSQQKDQKQQKIEDLQEQVRENGGGRLQQLESEMRRLERDKAQSQTLSNNYLRLVQQLHLPEQLEPGCFAENIQSAHELAEQEQDNLNQLEQQQDEQKHQQRDYQNEKQKVFDELEILKGRKSNISGRQLAIRQRLCEELGVGESRLPFAGELIRVSAEQQQWQGAIERVLHNFALSLLVPDELYREVSDYVEQTHLNTRLVYYRIKAVDYYAPQRPEGNSLLSKVELKRDSEHYRWLHKELQNRFDYRCCDNMADFRRSEKAISLKGQVKSGKFRHEKDDRHQLQDKSRYVLGWSNEEKIKLLVNKYRHLEERISSLSAALSNAQKRKKQLEDKRRQALNLADFNLSFEQINWPVYMEQLEMVRNEKRQLEASSDLLKQLQEQVVKEKQRLKQLEERHEQSLKEQGEVETRIATDEEALKDKQNILKSRPQEDKEQCFPTMAEFFQKHGSRSLRLDMLSNQSGILRTKLNERVQNLEAKRRNKENQMLSGMKDYAFLFPNDVTELDISDQSLPEFQQMFIKLQEEDLPRHEARFKAMLNQDTIRAMALFRSFLDKVEEDIDARINMINRSLRELDYQTGTYIEIDGIASPDLEIREFKQRLKSCVEFSTEDNFYTEQKFQQVKSLIEQMRNEPKWTQKVVDVRYWQLFNVIERFREDNSEKECYSDSGGKSGGQKEKLAYSILAAAILLQYRLIDTEPGVSAKRRFNLVVIDEAFARGSKDSTRFGLELFKKLGLQLLLVTPLQKLDVIEHYVRHVHFVDQKNNRSMVLNMTIDEYRERLSQHKTLQKYQALVEEV